MKKLFLGFLIGLSFSGYTQTLKDRIQGDWVCIKILDSKGNPSIGKFGESSKYLRFTFDKSTYSICQSPFDKGLPIDIVFKDEKSFDWLPNAKYNVPERIYYIKKLENNNLILSTNNRTGDTICYYFLNQKLFPIKNDINEMGLLLVKHIVNRNSAGASKVSEYIITNDSTFLAPSPTFEYSKGGNFGDVFSFSIKLPKTFKLNEVSSEYILEFDVSEQGAENIKATGQDEEIKQEIIRVMEKLKKSWKPVVVNNNTIKTRQRLRIHFYKPEVTLNLPINRKV